MTLAVLRRSMQRVTELICAPVQHNFEWRAFHADSDVFNHYGIGAGSGVPGGAQAPPELFLAPPEPFEPPLTIKTIMH